MDMGMDTPGSLKEMSTGPNSRTEVLWKLLILTAFLGTCALLIYLWRTILTIKPRQYEVTLDQIKMKMNDLKNENRDLEKNIASWEEKAREAKKQAETKREHKCSLARARDALVDQELRALTSKKQELKERKTFLEDQSNAMSSQKTAKEAELNLLKKKLDMMVEFSENRKLTCRREARRDTV
ncbi:transport and Golgi organization protein 1 homolog isoform X2 [Neovison vison]|uniref:transport and Golgi organization protein 1 homolog isoform X2 n=1 Tax=Neovison vison TaxID=452646 RepID=UPI001CF078E6|nr:transport and Golgi organization protein 1 homolog isoform X2 [Neogale vison]